MFWFWTRWTPADIINPKIQVIKSLSQIKMGRSFLIKTFGKERIYFRKDFLLIQGNGGMFQFPFFSGLYLKITVNQIFSFSFSVPAISSWPDSMSDLACCRPASSWSLHHLFKTQCIKNNLMSKFLYRRKKKYNVFCQADCSLVFS
jgi:hypothetical protein